MLTPNYLTLRLVRLKAGEEWASDSNCLSFLFPKAGTGNYLAGSVVQSVSAGDILVVNGTPRGKLCVGNRGELLFQWFSVSLEQLYPLFSVDEIGALHNIADIFKQVKLYPAGTPVARECRRLLDEAPPQLNLDHRGHVLRVAASVLSSEFNSVRTQRPGFLNLEEQIGQVFESLSIDEVLNLSVGELAVKFSCSRRHLNRLFHQYFGLSVAALRMEMRLLKAVSLLRDPSAKIINVAEQCGFNHLGLFNTCFRKRFGNSPGEWRKAAASRKGPLPKQPVPHSQGSGAGHRSLPFGDLGSASASGFLPYIRQPEAAASQEASGPGPGKNQPALLSGSGITIRVRV